LTGYLSGKHEAPNGLAFDPLVGLTSDLNIGLLPRKQLYLFWQSDFWVQSGAVGAPVTSQREVDADLGLAWNYFGPLEFRASAYALNNLNRGCSLARPDGYKDGWKLENRYTSAPVTFTMSARCPSLASAIIRRVLWWETMVRCFTQVCSRADI